MDDITNYKNQFNLKIEDLINDIGKVKIDNSTTRSLVKKQMEEFATIYSKIEINKTATERLNRRIDNLPVINDLKDTDEYLNKYLPFRIQNMIDDTLFNCLGSFEMQKLLAYEYNAFNKLCTNIKSIGSPLYKQEHHIPSEEER
jgi:hypothetical protein